MKKSTVIILLSLAALVVAGVLLGPHLLDWKREHDARARLEQQPIYQLLGRHEPEAFAKVVDLYLARERGTITAPQFNNAANAELAAVATRRLAHASDAAVLALMNDMLTNARALAKQPGDACFRFLFPLVSGPPDISAHFDAATQARTLAAMTEVIRTSVESPAPLPEAAAVQDKLAAVINGVYEQHGADAQMIAHAEDPRVDRAKVCAITISLYERVMAWPPADSSALIRVMTQTR